MDAGVAHVACFMEIAKSLVTESPNPLTNRSGKGLSKWLR